MLLKLCCSLFKKGDIRLKCGLQHCTNTNTLLCRQLLRIEKNINYWIMWYLLVSLCIIIGQFSRSYFTVPLTKFKRLKCSPSIWTQRFNENLSNPIMLGVIELCFFLLDLWPARGPEIPVEKTWSVTYSTDLEPG